MAITRGSTSVLVTVFIQDTTQTNGAGLSGLTAGTAGLVVAYRAQGHAGGATTFPLVAGTLGTWASGSFIAVDATNMPGVYEVGLPNAALTTGNYVDVFVHGATNAAALPLKLELVAVDPQNATSFGLTRLDAAISTRMATFSLPANFSILAVDATGFVTYNNAAPPTAATIATAAAAAILTTPADKLVTNASGFVTYSNAAPPTAAVIAATSAAAIIVNPANKLAVDGSGFVTYNNAAPPTPPTPSDIATAAAAAILLNPVNKLATDVSGFVTATNAAAPTTSQIAAAILANPTHPLANDTSGALPANNLVTGLLDLANGVETGMTLRQAQRAQTAAAAGVFLGASTNNVSIYAAGNPGTLRIAATLSTAGRQSVTLTL